MIAAKKALRKEVQATLKALPAAEVRRQSEAIHTQLRQQAWFPDVRSVAIYLNFPTGEVETGDLVDTWLSATPPVRVFVPMVDPGYETMTFYEVKSAQDLKDGFVLDKWGITVPAPDTLASRADPLRDSIPVDLVICPGLAFDQNCHRLGRGRGHYDKYQAAWLKEVEGGRLPKSPRWVAVAFDEQMVSPGTIPMEDTDLPLDAVVTPSVVYNRA